MTTVARIHEVKNGHWYTAQGQSCYEVPRKDGKGMRKTTIADARELGLLPSVTHILDTVLRKPALEAWKLEQSLLACLTSPRNEGEELDAFIKRILSDEKVEDQEAQAARDRGTEIHAALEALFQGQPISDEIDPWVRPAFQAVCKYGELACTEKILVGADYAGKCDLIQLAKDCWWLWDWKSAKKLPDPAKGGAWSEHRLQASAYANAWFNYLCSQPKGLEVIRTGNIYISTVECGKFVICEHAEWQQTYWYGFKPLVEHWRWSTGYSC